MKNRKLNWILLPLVILIWGFVAYRVFWKEPAEQPRRASRIAPKEEAAKAFRQDSQVRLSLDYTDPYQAERRQESPTTKPTIVPKSLPVITRQEVVKKQSVVNWPTIRYKGVSVNGGKKTAIISINGKNYFPSQGQEISGVRLVSIGKSSIRVQYEGASKEIKKEE